MLQGLYGKLGHKPAILDTLHTRDCFPLSPSLVYRLLTSVEPYQLNSSWMVSVLMATSPRMVLQILSLIPTVVVVKVISRIIPCYRATQCQDVVIVNLSPSNDVTLYVFSNRQASMFG